jgi:hypothetical protein
MLEACVPPDGWGLRARATYLRGPGRVGPTPMRVYQVSGRDRVALRRAHRGLVRSRLHPLLVCTCSARVRLVWFVQQAPVMCHGWLVVGSPCPRGCGGQGWLPT